MSGSSFIVAVNALMLKRLRLPDEPERSATDRGGAPPVARPQAVTSET